jgi:hypothetical protein
VPEGWGDAGNAERVKMKEQGIGCELERREDCRETCDLGGGLHFSKKKTPKTQTFRGTFSKKALPKTLTFRGTFF